MVWDVVIDEPLLVRLATVRERIGRAARRAGRYAEAITLVAVTKTLPAEHVRMAALAGITDLGENKVQEATAKITALGGIPSLRWHLIGHLQRNKAKHAVELFDVIQSVDSLELATTLARHAAGRERALDVFAQVNVSGETSKSGFAPSEVARQAVSLAALPRLRWRGLMTIAPEGAGDPQLRTVFAATRRLHQELVGIFDPNAWDALSMGMSDDFEIAIEEGATHVRVGRALFGERTVGAQA